MSIQLCSYKATITSAKSGESALTPESEKYKQLNQKIQEFVNSEVFKRHLMQTGINSTVFKLTLRISKDGNVHLLDKPQEFVSRPTILPSPIHRTESTKSTTTPKGLQNPQYGCYANSAFQLLHHIPSLKRSVIDKLPNYSIPTDADEDERLDLEERNTKINRLKDYSKIRGATEIVEGVNVFRAKKYQLSTLIGNASSEVFSTLMETSRYPGFSLISRSSVSMKEDQQKIVADSPELMRIVTADNERSMRSNELILRLAPSADGNFSSMLQSTFEDVTEKTGVNNGEAVKQKSETQEKQVSYRIRTSTKFSESPSQLMISIPKYHDISSRTQQETKGVSETLDLSKYMADGVKARKLYLKGFTHHGGSGKGTVGGHYTSYFAKVENGKTVYYLANDNLPPQKISKSDFLRAASYAADLYYDDERLP